MYFYCKNSSRKIIHYENCRYAKNTEAMGTFHSLSCAHRAGYRLCRHCNPAVSMFKAESAEIMGLCQSNPLCCELGADCIKVTSLYDKWILSPALKRTGFFIYHGNKLEKANAPAAEYKGYHRQNAFYDSITESLNYILAHDEYRMSNPFVVYGEKTPPRKGTKRYKKAQRKAKRTAKQRAVRNVISLIESLNTKNVSA